MQRVLEWTNALRSQKVCINSNNFFFNSHLSAKLIFFLPTIIEPRAVAGRRETKAAHERRAARADARRPRSSDNLRALHDRQDLLRRGAGESGDRRTGGGDPAARRCAVERAREAGSSRAHLSDRFEEASVPHRALRGAPHGRQRSYNLEKT